MMMNNFKRYMICFILTLTCSACFAMNGPAVPPVTSSGGSPFATEDYVNNAIGADLIFWGSASTSADLAGYNRLDSATFYPQVTKVIANVSAVESQLGKFVTNLGSPDIDEIAPGLAWVHIYAVSDGATIKFRPTLWKISAGGVVTQLATATRYRNINTSGDIISSEMDIAVAIPLEKTDRIFTALYGYAVDGSAPDLTVYLGGVNGTHIHLPVTSNVSARTNGDSAEDFAAKDVTAATVTTTGNADVGGTLGVTGDSEFKGNVLINSPYYGQKTYTYQGSGASWITIATITKSGTGGTYYDVIKVKSVGWSTAAGLGSSELIYSIYSATQVATLVNTTYTDGSPPDIQVVTDANLTTLVQARASGSSGNMYSSFTVEVIHSVNEANVSMTLQ